MEQIALQKAEIEKVAVLVVDDEYGPRESVAFSLSTEFAVETAERAGLALEKVRNKAYGVVILDIRMPEMDGITALQELRKIDPHVSVIMLTGYGTLLTAQQSMVGGANQYLRKPPDVNELLDAVRQQAQATKLRRHQARLSQEVQEMNVALKQELERHGPEVWQARASVELVHDLNNPLTVVMGYATLLVSEAKSMAQVEPSVAQRVLEYASMVEKAADYCRHLAENWRRTSKKTTEFARVDLVQVLAEVRQVIFFGNIAIQISGMGEAAILGARFELIRVFQNIFKNSLEAGATSVAATLARNGERIELSVSDNGSGMDAETLKRAIRGGFTSKATGTGLGINITRHLIGIHGGTFDVESEPGKGTTVRLSFPAAPAA